MLQDGWPLPRGVAGDSSHFRISKGCLHPTLFAREGPNFLINPRSRGITRERSRNSFLPSPTRADRYVGRPSCVRAALTAPPSRAACLTACQPFVPSIHPSDACVRGRTWVYVWMYVCAGWWTKIGEDVFLELFLLAFSSLIHHDKVYHFKFSNRISNRGNIFEFFYLFFYFIRSQSESVKKLEKFTRAINMTLFIYGVHIGEVYETTYPPRSEAGAEKSILNCFVVSVTYPLNYEPGLIYDHSCAGGGGGGRGKKSTL